MLRPGGRFARGRMQMVDPRDLVLRGITAAAAQAYDSLVRLRGAVNDKPEWMEMAPPVTNLVSKRQEQATEIVVRVAPL